MGRMKDRATQQAIDRQSAPVYEDACTYCEFTFCDDCEHNVQERCETCKEVGSCSCDEQFEAYRETQSERRMEL